MNGGGPVVVAVTGASGAIHAHRLVEVLLEAGHEVFLVASATGRRIIREELPALAHPETVFRFAGPRSPRVFSERDFGAPFASGSFRFRGMAVVPASMGTVGAIASGVSLNSIHRGADVALKERRPLVLVPRETPLSAVHLENLLKLARAGAVVLPACPAFYQRPASVAEQVDFVVSRVLDHLGIENRLYRRWKEEPAEPAPGLAEGGADAEGR
ncbi:MAG: UbiX family flavin prenyltransferase [Thermoanaerobaculia bacterium]